MKFICSINSVVAKHVDATTGKIEAKGNFTSFNENWEALELTTDELSEHLKQKSGLCAWHLHEGKRKANRTGVIKAGLIIVDIDNQADHKDKDGNKVQKQELTVEEALELDICKKYLTVVLIWALFALLNCCAKRLLFVMATARSISLVIRLVISVRRQMSKRRFKCCAVLV